MTTTNKPRLSKPTIEKLGWLEENYNKYKYQHELLDAMANKFNKNKKHLIRVVKVFLGKKENTSDWRGRLKTKKPSSGCYFCSSEEKVISHHVSYSPEITIELCYSCHNKIHHVMDNQHKLEIKRLNQIRKLKKFLELWD